MNSVYEVFFFESVGYEMNSSKAQWLSSFKGLIMVLIKVIEIYHVDYMIDIPTKITTTSSSCNEGIPQLH